MEQQKQIEEMKVDVFNSIAWKDLDDGVAALDIDNTTEKLYFKGYRKQSEVAREIFAELTDMYKDIPMWGAVAVAYLKDLKKKYIQEREN